MPSTEDIDAIFDLFNTGGSGIPAAQMAVALRACGATPSEDEIGQITAEASVFDKNAFTAAVNKIPEISQPEAETAFGTFDTHANGYMALADLTHVLANLGEGLNPDLIEKFKAAAEPDGEGQVNLRHFVDILYKGL